MEEKLMRIMCVEDESDIQTIVRLSLETLGGFTVDICSSGSEALARVSGFKPQLILLDVMMPGMDGPTTLGKLREIPEFSDTPVVFMTAKVQPSEITGYKAIGAADVIPKPFDPMTLPGQVQEVWERCHG